jgi:hypothetical protein
MNRMSQAALRLLGLATVLGLALTACTTPPGAPTVVREAAKPPPPLAAGPHTDTYWGVTLADPWRRLEDTRRGPRGAGVDARAGRRDDEDLRPHPGP